MTNMLNEQEKKLLAEIAQKTIKGEENDFENLPEKLKEPAGVFVTLKLRGELRGCIGYTEPAVPLGEAVADCARSAACSDPRFDPVQESEIDNLEIEISVLSNPAPLTYQTPDDLLQKLTPGFGITIKKQNRQATFLPQVWQELPDKKEFLRHLCFKAGLPPDAWQQGGLEVFVYTAQIFGK